MKRYKIKKSKILKIPETIIEEKEEELDKKGWIAYFKEKKRNDEMSIEDLLLRINNKYCELLKENESLKNELKEKSLSEFIIADVIKPIEKEEEKEEIVKTKKLEDINRCTALTKNGKGSRCKNNKKYGNFCYIHKGIIL